MDGQVVEEEPVGQPLDGAGRELRETALVERGRDLGELPLLEEPEAAGFGGDIEGEGTLGRGERRRREDQSSMERAVKRDLGDGPPSGQGPDVVGPRVANREPPVTGRAVRLGGFVS
ncbi:MAG: hypothetical protein ACREEC_14565 [Thermoplasmata archaeon]